MEIKEFLNYLESERNYSSRTIEEYGDDLREFETFFTGLDAGLTWENIDSDVIRDWMGSMMDKGNIATSINRRLSAVRSFYRFALSRGLVEADPAHGVKGPKKDKPLPQFVREADMDALLDESMWNLERYADVRARTIILMIYETGVRTAELTALDDAAVDFSACRIKVDGKGGKQRMVPFGDELRCALEAYMRKRDEAVVRQSPALFLSDKGERLTYWQFILLVGQLILSWLYFYPFFILFLFKIFFFWDTRWFFGGLKRPPDVRVIAADGTALPPKPLINL